MTDRNILLDFVNPETRRIFGLYRIPRNSHVSYLIHNINFCVFLCDQYTICQPGVVRECRIADRAFEVLQSYLSEGLVRVPLSDESFEDFDERRARTYFPQKEIYQEMFDSRKHTTFHKHPEIVIPKIHKSGDGIFKRWERFSDIDELPDDWRFDQWKSKIEVGRKAISRVHIQGRPLTWPEISQEFSKENIDQTGFAYRNFLQHLYLLGYREENDLVIVTRIPNIKYLIGVSSIDLRFDYEALREALRVLGMWQSIKLLQADDMIRLRSHPLFSRFRRYLTDVFSSATSARDVARVMSEQGEGVSRLSRRKLLDDHIELRLRLQFGLRLFRDADWDILTDTLETVLQAESTSVSDGLGLNDRPSGNWQTELGAKQVTNNTINVKNMQVGSFSFEGTAINYGQIEQKLSENGDEIISALADLKNELVQSEDSESEAALVELIEDTQASPTPEKMKKLMEGLAKAGVATKQGGEYAKSASSIASFIEKMSGLLS